MKWPGDLIGGWQKAGTYVWVFQDREPAAGSASSILLAIQEKLDGVEWTPDTLEEIAALLQANGYRVRDLNDEDVAR